MYACILCYSLCIYIYFVCRPKDIIKSGRSSIVLPHTLKEARVKLRASQQTIGSMATEIDTLELENKTLRERIEMVCMCVCAYTILTCYRQMCSIGIRCACKQTALNALK